MKTNEPRTFGDLQDDLSILGFPAISKILDESRAANETMLQTIERLVPCHPEQNLKDAIKLLAMETKSANFDWSTSAFALLIILIAHTTIENSKPSISIPCQVCGLPATKRVNRTWHDGCWDVDMKVCNKHAESDPDGIWTMDKIVPL